MSDFSADNRATSNDVPRPSSSSTPLPSSPAPSPFGPLSASRGEQPTDDAVPPQPQASQPTSPPFSREPERAPAPDPVANGADRPQADANEQRLLAEVKGRIEVADEVMEKVAALAALEVPGVADLGGDFERGLESVRERIGIGQKRGNQGVRAKLEGRDVSLTITIMIEYGHVVMDVARNVKNNVALQANRMLGLRVVEVNVKVDDVKMPNEGDDADDADDADDGLLSIDG
jgi:uncharacterized alkaline shock family protein YloU